MDQTHLSRLPTELRNTIYTMALLSPSHIDIKINLTRPKTRRWRPAPLLQTCRQIRHETLAIYYGGNDFRVDIVGSGAERVLYYAQLERVMYRWLLAIGPAPRSFLVSIERGCFRGFVMADEATARLQSERMMRCVRVRELRCRELGSSFRTGRPACTMRRPGSGRGVALGRRLSSIEFRRSEKQGM